MTMLSTNLKKLMKLKKLTQEDLAKKAGISQVAMHKILVGKTKRPGRLIELAQALGTTAELLISGDSQEINGVLDNNVTFHYRNSRKIPLISFVQAGTWGDAMNPYELNDAEDWIDWPEKSSENAYAVKNSGLSMFNPRTGEGYPDGCILKIEPESVKPAVNGSDVIVRTPDGAVTFKQLQIDGNNKYLSAINPDWPERIIKIPEDSVICGVCDGYFMRTGK
jgi:SOS-response transcriptional repressor LexA